MDEQTNDDATAQLVHAVLQAVESRLDAVRHDVTAYASEVERRHHDTLAAVAAMERRIADLERAEQHRRSTASTVAERLDDMSARLDTLSQAAIDRMAPTPTAGMPTPDSLPQLDAAGHEVASAGDLSSISKPLLDPTQITTQVPIVTDPSIQRMTSLPIPAAVRPTMTAPTLTSFAASASAEPPLNELDATPNDVELDDAEPDDAEPDDADPNDAERSDSELDTVDDGIDLERLSELLAERLSNLELPPRLD
jgi:hypothetical protein